MANGLPTMGASDRNPRKTTGTHYTTPVGNTMNDSTEVDSQATTKVDGSDIQGKRMKKLSFVAAELKRMRYF
jgi:hypothetical protein